MQIKYLNKVESTQLFLKSYIQTNKQEICFYTNNQTNGIGSRDNLWQGEEGNLFFSFAIDEANLPNDLALQSASIYFSYIFKSILEDLGSKIFIKWPNDFYINNDKIGGIITNKVDNFLLCGIGINLKKTKSFKAYLDINIKSEILLKNYFSQLNKFPSWKQIFSKYRLEFYHSKKYYTNINNKKVLLAEASLNNDGSLTINGQKVFSLR